MTETEKAYLAGLFDGEGTLGYYFKTKAKNYVASLAIYNTNTEVMRWIKNTTGIGGIYLNKGGKNAGWQWQLTSKPQIKGFLSEIQPYLIIKADQVDLLLELWNAEQGICGSGKRLSMSTLKLRQEVEAKMKLLKTANLTSVH